MILKLVIFGLLMLFLTAQDSTAEGSTAGSYRGTLPWEIITQSYTAQKLIGTRSEGTNGIDYAVSPGVGRIVIPIYLKESQASIPVHLGLSIWQQTQWSNLPGLNWRIDPNDLVVDSSAMAEGFYQLAVLSGQNDAGTEKIFNAIVAEDWKKDLFAWCQYNKEQIEIHSDPQLIYSSLVVSHFENLMELADQSETLTENVLSTISEVLKAKSDFDAGNCPNLVMGLNIIRLKRFEGEAVEQFSVFIPQDFNPQKPIAISLHLDIGRQPLRNTTYSSSTDLVDIWWHTIDNENINWKNFEYFFNALKQKLNVDENRIYVSGDCRNGIAAIFLALHFPDKWAECSASLGNASRHLSGNALNLPLIFVKGPHNEDYLVSYYDFAVECFKYHGCRFFKCSNPLSITQVRGSSVPTRTRDLSPYRVFYTIESLAHPTAYWVQIDGRTDENFIATIDAIVWNQSILVKTDNVDAYTLNLQLAPLDCSRPMQIIENDEHLGSVTGSTFSRKSPKYENAAYVKNRSLHGPVTDVFTDPYIVVWKGDGTIESLARQVAGSGPCLPDANLAEASIISHNLIFIGRPSQSEHLAPIADKLPVLVEDSRLTADGRVYEGDCGAIFVYPNPLHPQRYLAVLTAATDKTMDAIEDAWKQIKTMGNVDIGIFRLSENQKAEWLIAEKFNTVWGWHKTWEAPLLQLDKPYPKWKWWQWLAHVLRQQLTADVMIFEDPFRSEDLPGTGSLTLRDLVRLFTNDWIVKIRLKGSELRELLMVPFQDLTSRQVAAPVIDGICMVKPSDGRNAIGIEELENDRFYTVAFPYRAVNGKRMGMVLKDYRLEGEGFLVTLLRDYLQTHKDMDVAAELNAMQLNIF